MCACAHARLVCTKVCSVGFSPGFGLVCRKMCVKSVLSV